ncbi:MAG: flagellar M-ring protein FliF [Spirochaetaceae bacterium]|nr:flagellar M-ring protein FliF [Spirochaetaceae bacterium]MBO7485026.1 flagellar M-ring protein FliF [Spirochaetaceae bacterium]
MNEWLNKVLARIKELWAKWSLVQRIILISIIVVAIIALIVITRVSASPSAVPLFNTSITDETVRDKILYRLSEENVEASVTADGKIMVQSESTARRMRSVLVREDLVPTNVDPWELFDVERWTITDFERNVNLRRSITNVVTQHIEALDDVDKANVVITMPERQLFEADQNPVTASVIIYQKPGSDILTNRKKVEGIQKLLLKAVEGLSDDNITISDSEGNILNDFEGMAEFDRLSIAEKQQKTIQKQETYYRAQVLNALQATFGADRVRDLNVKVEMDFSKKTVEDRKITPIEMRPDNPDTPYDESEYVESVTVSSETVTKRWTGTGYNPEGPAGVEGQNPPVYSDMSNLYGTTEESGVKKNQDYNVTVTNSEKNPSIDRITVSVNIDGTWQKKYDEDGNPIVTNGRIEREYTPISEIVLEDVTKQVQDAVGYNRLRGDSVSVVNIPFDRQEQFDKEDALYLKQLQTRQTLFWSAIALVAILLLFVIFRFISRERERRRRLREEEELRRHQMERERALFEAEQAGMEVTMSAEERSRLELQENAITMAKEHPEDVALLIRTWLMEE